MMMQSYTMSGNSGYCMTCAAAGTSMRVCGFLGTAILAVSLFVRLFILLVQKV